MHAGPDSGQKLQLQRVPSAYAHTSPSLVHTLFCAGGVVPHVVGGGVQLGIIVCHAPPEHVSRVRHAARGSSPYVHTSPLCVQVPVVGAEGQSVGPASVLGGTSGPAVSLVIESVAVSVLPSVGPVVLLHAAVTSNEKTRIVRSSFILTPHSSHHVPRTSSNPRRRAKRVRSMLPSIGES
jgi:hypothetical protein